MKENVKIVFWGTPEFALPTLKALIKNGYSVVAAVTNPDEPVGRKSILTPPPVKLLAQKYNIPVLQPESLKIENWKLKIPEADLFVVAAYGKLIPKGILDLPGFGALNIHPSLLPRWRGPSPVQYTILYGDRETGVTIIKMDERMDHGPIVASSDFKVKSSKFTYQELHDTLAKLGTKLLMEIIPEWVAGKITPQVQEDAKATYSKILKKDDGRIDWSKSAMEIERMIRAFTPWPGAWTLWPARDKIFRLRIEHAAFFPEDAGVPAGVVLDKREKFLIATGKGVLEVQTVTLEGKKSMDGASFLCGHPDIVNARLI